jgi:hypothetical protein
VQATGATTRGDLVTISQATPAATHDDQARALGHAVYWATEDATAAALDRLTAFLRDGNRLALIDAADLLDGTAQRIRALHALTS